MCPVPCNRRGEGWPARDGGACRRARPGEAPAAAAGRRGEDHAPGEACDGGRGKRTGDDSRSVEEASPSSGDAQRARCRGREERDAGSAGRAAGAAAQVAA